ncbi:MAG: hypothetical protein KJN69_13330 [Gammaproteobacteria bacterium]|nr:hypothetical protein [Gammaproteobacteria bacterium]
MSQEPVLLQINLIETNPPQRCAGYGSLQSFSLTTWENGLGNWTVGRHDIKKSTTFDTQDWAVFGSLPDGKPGQAAFVANLDQGDCEQDDETGALNLDSPAIVIPLGTAVPRISVSHWLATEFLFDGGNFKISVNGGAWTLIPDSAIEVGPYNETLAPPTQVIEGVTYPLNTNPLASQPAFTGTDPGTGSGAWGESHINLYGIAESGDSVRLRFDFGVDGCGGEVGWYVDDVEFYSCEGEPEPSDCGNGMLDAGEQCDDGNTFFGDGCSSTCQVESGWICSDPTAPGVIFDPSFEKGTPNPDWDEFSSSFGTPICDAACGFGSGSGPLDGDFWVWFGGTFAYEEARVSQAVTIPAAATQLNFGLEVNVCNTSADYLQVLVDGVEAYRIDGASDICGDIGYSPQSADISAWADGGLHTVEFHSEVFGPKRTSFFLDVVELPGTPSICRLPNLTLIKNLQNDDGGSATLDDFQAFIDGSPVNWNTPVSLTAGIHTASESNMPGYQPSGWSNACASDGTVTLAAGDERVCEITNDDLAPTLTLTKNVINNDGGLATQAQFQAYIDGNPVPWNTPVSLAAGQRTVSEDGLFGYAAGPWGADCAADGSITLVPGENATCVVSNDDIAPTLTLNKIVVNNDGGTLTANDFPLFVDGNPVISGVPVQLVAGAHVASESGDPGYAASGWDGHCAPDGSVTLAVGENKVCEITNDDIAPTLTLQKNIVNDDTGTETNPDAFALKIDGSVVLHNVANVISAGLHSVSEDGLPGYLPGPWGGACGADGSITLVPGEQAVCTITNDDLTGTSLILVNQLVADNGGTALPSDWTLSATGPTPISGNGPVVSSDTGFIEGTYDLTAIGPAGYGAGDWVCQGTTQIDGDTVTLAAGDSAICVITHNDIPPTLTVVKSIVNDDGGTVVDPNAFGLTIDDIPVSHNTATELIAGAHRVSETGLPGYQASAWGGHCDTVGNVVLALAEHKTCTITNNDIAPTLTVVKNVVNDDGGTVTDPNAFGLKVDGLLVLHNATNEVSPGQHAVSETGLTGYAAGSWGGDCAANGEITLSLGQSATCSVTNDDIAPTLRVVKTIVNDNGGTITDPNAFGLNIDGSPVSHNVANTLNAGQHSVSENGLPGYFAGPWGGDCNSEGWVTLLPGDNKVCTITNDDSNATSLTLIKQVINNNGGSAPASAWTLIATGPSPFSGIGPEVSSGDGILPGIYDLSESGGPAGYAAGSWACQGGTQNDGDTITLALGESATCTITNNDIAPSLKIIKSIVNDDGGAVTDPNTFGLQIDGIPVQHNAETTVNAGVHVVSEVGLAGYQADTWGGDCDAAGNVFVALGENKICTITNNDIAPTLQVIKNIINNSGGTVTDPNAFGLKVDGNPVVHGAINEFNIGLHTVTETGLTGYQASNWGGDCGLDGTISLSLGQNATCTITNDDIAPTLKVVKSIINDNGGTITDPNAFGLKVDGAPVLHNNANSLIAGNHVVSETGLSDYVPGAWEGDCDPTGNVTLALGENKTCTIINDDSNATGLTLIKEVINDDGGIAQPSEWTLIATGPTSIVGSGPVVSSGAGFFAGVYELSEQNGPPGYSAAGWVCTGGTQNDGETITIALGDSAVCTITNDDIAPNLTIVKSVINDNGGSISDPNAFGLKIDGNPVQHNVTVKSTQGAHIVSENGLTGYQASAWGGDCNSDGTITLALGQNATCTVTNNDIAPTLKVIKNVVNDNGGTVSDPNAFGLRVDGNLVTHNVDVPVAVGQHLVSEDGLAGYAAGTWGSDCDAAGNVTLSLGETKTCTITNDDIQPSLTLVNTVINDHGGTLSVDAFPLFISGNPVNSGDTVALTAGAYAASATSQNGYAASSWGGDCDAFGNVTLAPGNQKVCTITHDDIAPTIKLQKIVINNDGGTVTDPNAFGLRVDGNPVLNGEVNEFSAGPHIVSELGLAGYIPSYWVGDCDPDGGITLSLGQSAICSISNDDSPATSLTLVKSVKNDHGGVATPMAWTLSATGGPTPFSGIGPSISSDLLFEPGTYDLSESGGTTGYTASAWSCTGGTQIDIDTVTIAIGESAICTITNDDVPAILTVTKNIENNFGGTASDPNQFGLAIDGIPVLNGAANEVSAGVHVVSETGLPGYEAGDWGGDCNPDGSISLSAGQVASCSITNSDSPATLTVIKNIINDNGGTITDPNAFGLMVDFNPVSHGVANALALGSHTVSETGLAGYAAGAWGGDCDAAGNVTLEMGQNKTCTITNDDIAPTLTINKSITNDDGGTITDPNAFGLMVDGNPVLHNVANEFAAGPHLVSETGLEGYQAGSWGSDCDAAGHVTLLLGENKTCTITNDDIAPTLTVVKNITNDDGGTITDPNAFGLKVDGNPVSHNVTVPVSAGAHTVSETGLADYTPGPWGGDCSAAGVVTLELGQNKTCTITNDDSDATSLTLIKQVTNDDGGSAAPSAWILSASGPTPFSGSAPTVTSGEDFAAGTYSLSESGPGGYSPISWVCVGGNQDGSSITLTLGQSATCTITNDDIAPTLTVVKNITNDDGGTITDPNAFGLTVDGNPVSHNVANEFAPGPHVVAETGLAGYQAGSWSGDCDAAGNVTLVLGQSKTCTITNDDIAPTLTVVKYIINDNGGAVIDPNAFGLMVDGIPVLHNESNVLAAGPHSVSEAGLAGYQASAWGGDCSGDGNITLALGQDATCSITNDDLAAMLTVTKTIINDDGGAVSDPNAFGLMVDGSPVLHNVATSFTAGLHTVSEAGQPGYLAGSWGGDCDAAGNVTLVLGQSKTCTITNDDIAPTLTVVKNITNDDGGTITDPDAFGLTVDGNPVLHNVANEISAGLHTVSETGLPGYIPGPWSGDCNPDGSIMLTIGQIAVCSITNNDSDATSLTLIKQITNNDGGTASPSDWILSATGGPTPFSNNGPSVSSGDGFEPGTYGMAESGPGGYDASAWTCVGGAQDGSNITLALGESAICTITNDDIAPTLKVLKTILNDNDGQETDPDAFGLRIDGGLVQHGVSYTLTAGSHTVSEDGIPGYIPGVWGTDCSPDGSIVLEPGDVATCSITNDDAEATSLTLRKEVINDHGGTALASAWILRADGPTPLEGNGPTVSSDTDFQAGVYILSEIGGPGGYEAGDWVCVPGELLTGNTLTLDNGAAAVCTITNDDVSTDTVIFADGFESN